MKVYIVIEWSDVISVMSTREKAERFISEAQDNEDLFIEEWEVD